jgi:hypothetical protein
VTDPGEMELRDTRRDDPARFLREMRELRSHAGLGHAELAARAHYPCDAIKAAEAGPSLPDLPVLSAYVRGCGGTVAEWEERWRAVTGRPASPLLTARGTGWSEAADAGARIVAAPLTADEEGSDRVMAALNRVADGMAGAPSAPSAPSTPSAPSAPSAPSGQAPDAWTPATPAAANTDVWTPATPAAANMDVWTPAKPAPANADVWTPAAPAATNADVWTPATPPAADADVWTPAAPAAANADVWTPATPPAAATNADVWTPATLPAADADVWTPAPRAPVDATVTAAEVRPGSQRAADSRPTVSLARTGQPARSRRPFASRTTLAVCAVALVLVAVLIALVS